MREVPILFLVFPGCASSIHAGCGRLKGIGYLPAYLRLSYITCSIYEAAQLAAVAVNALVYLHLQASLHFGTILQELLTMQAM